MTKIVENISDDNQIRGQKGRSPESTKQRFILLDRDGTVIRDPGSPLMTVVEADVLPGVIDGLRMLKKADYLLLLVSNQSGIARGQYTEQQFLDSQQQMFAVFREHGITFDDAEHCPHLPDSGCGCRKPDVGMWERLLKRHPGLRPEDGAMIGNRDGDVKFGKAVGCRSARIDSGQFPYTFLADDSVRHLGEFAEHLIQGVRPVMTVTEAAAFAQEARAAGKTVVTTNGTFDLFHPGHLFLFTEARKQGDVFIVGVNSDASVKRYKGPDRPIESQDVRAGRLAHHADAVFIFDDDDPRGWLRLIYPDIHVNAATYGKDCIEAEVLSDIEAELVLVPVRSELGSTTEIIQKRSQKNA